MKDNKLNDRQVKVTFKPLSEELQAPFYRHRGDAGMDICAASDYLILPGQTVLVSTNLAVELPEGYELQVRPRSGLSLKTNLIIANSPGTIDAGYRDEIKIIVHNNSDASLALEAAKNIDTAKTSESSMGTVEFSLGTVCVYDLDVKSAPHGAYKICKGDRIAQLVLAPIYELIWTKSEQNVDFDRKGGFGHSGRA